jgi:NAD(P)H-dependent flavin oxidoreductase YrpB (nitropropane dioxygenase family)
VGQTVLGGQAVPVRRFVSLPPNCDASGEIDSMSLLAGQSVGLVREIKPAGQIVHELVEEARQIISRRLERSAKVLYRMGTEGFEPPTPSV